MFPNQTSQALVREQQLSAVQQKSSSQSLQILAPKPPGLEYHHAAGLSFSHSRPNQLGTGVPDPPSFDPTTFSPSRGSSQYAFSPLETAGALTQNRWPQDRQPDFSTFSPVPSIAKGDIQRNLPGAISQPSSSTLFKEGKHRDESRPLGTERAQAEDWAYSVDDNGGGTTIVDSDDKAHGARRGSHFELDELGMIVSQRFVPPCDAFEIQARIYPFYASPDIVATYEPSPANSPLNNEQIAEVFRHFVHVTGPSISLYERHPVDPSPFLRGRQIPKSRRHIWACTLSPAILPNLG